MREQPISSSHSLALSLTQSEPILSSIRPTSLRCYMSEEQGLPKATVNKVIKDCLPGELKVAAEVRDLVADASLGTYPSSWAQDMTFHGGIGAVFNSSL